MPVTFLFRCSSTIALLFKTIPIQGRARCQNTIQSFHATLLETKVSVHKRVSIITDGTPVMWKRSLNLSFQARTHFPRQCHSSPRCMYVCMYVCMYGRNWSSNMHYRLKHITETKHNILKTNSWTGRILFQFWELLQHMSWTEEQKAVVLQALERSQQQWSFCWHATAYLSTLCNIWIFLSQAKIKRQHTWRLWIK
jgi:hypothetical protein